MQYLVMPSLLSLPVSPRIRTRHSLSFKNRAQTTAVVGANGPASILP